MKGPVNEIVRVRNYAEFGRLFGGLSTLSELAYAVKDYFIHGGSEAIIVRVADGATSAQISLTPNGAFDLRASSPGAWANQLQVQINYLAIVASDTSSFNLIVQEVDPIFGQVRELETFHKLSIDPASPQYVIDILKTRSDLIRVMDDSAVISHRPDQTKDTQGNVSFIGLSRAGEDGDTVGSEAITGTAALADGTGIYTLTESVQFNMLCIPPLDSGHQAAFYQNSVPEAAAFCHSRRAMLIVDPKNDWISAIDAEQGVNEIRSSVGNSFATNVLVYFPQLIKPDPLKDNALRNFAPSGAIAGIISRTDRARGVWKAPAGRDASFTGVHALSVDLNGREIGILNSLGLNCLRSFPSRGILIWGGRTLAGADLLSSEWKYISVRRSALFLQESLETGTRWAVFEPNDEPLWARIRSDIDDFMQGLFGNGALQGSKPEDAFFVKCDSETTTQSDIDNGIVNILVGFAPLKPAEFVVLKIQHFSSNPNIE